MDGTGLVKAHIFVDREHSINFKSMRLIACVGRRTDAAEDVTPGHVSHGDAAVDLLDAISAFHDSRLRQHSYAEERSLVTNIDMAFNLVCAGSEAQPIDVARELAKEGSLILDSGDYKTAVDMLCSIDPFECIGNDSWRDRGQLREYFEKAEPLATSQGNICQSNPECADVAGRVRTL